MTSINIINGDQENITNGESFFKKLLITSHRKSYKTIYDFLKENGKQLGEDQPFYTIDLADVLWKAQLWRENFPNVTPYYAVKANADPVLLRLFVLLGYGFDCSTEGELRLVMKAHCDPKKIIFAHTIKTVRALHYASSIGCEMLTFDSEEELVKIHKHFPKAKLILRLKSASMQTVYNLSLKFGCEVTEAEQLLRAAKQLDLNVVGVSFHVGALCETPETFTSTIENSRLVFNIAKKLGYDFTVMDIGAGFFGSKERETHFCELSKEINNSLTEHFPDDDIKFIAEPGCYYVCSAVTLTTAIIGKKDTSKNKRSCCILEMLGDKSSNECSLVTKNQSSRVEREYFVNDGFYGSFFEHKEMYGVKPKPLLSASEASSRPALPSRVWGQTCCSEDVVCGGCVLPDMHEGEMIVWENMGAYSRAVCSTFTEVPLPDTRHVFIRNDRLKLDWITNLEDLTLLIIEKSDLVESEDFNEY